MGNCASEEKTSDLSLIDFELEYPIGRGTFGLVWRSYHKRSLKAFAIKEINKSLVIAKNAVQSTLNEKKLLSILRHPFMVNLHFAFQTHSSYFLVLDLMTGGDLRYYLMTNPNINEQNLKFLAACIISGLEYLHSNKVVHRDLKPENLIFDSLGYLCITDFGIARRIGKNKLNDTFGTPGYMAPEILFGQPYDCCSDFFSLGVILYECIMKKRPYNGKNRAEMRENILAKQTKLRKDEIHVGDSCIDFINKLLQRLPQNRLGMNGIDSVKKHKWFDGFNWESLYEKSIVSEFKQIKKDNFFIDQVEFIAGGFHSA